MPRKTPSTSRVLTAKNLSVRAYRAIHDIPHGYRQDTLKALLNAAADAASIDPEWYKAALTGNLTVLAKRNG